MDTLIWWVVCAIILGITAPVWMTVVGAIIDAFTEPD